MANAKQNPDIAFEQSEQNEAQRKQARYIDEAYAAITDVKADGSIEITDVENAKIGLKKHSTTEEAQKPKILSLCGFAPKPDGTSTTITLEERIKKEGQVWELEAKAKNTPDPEQKKSFYSQALQLRQSFAQQQESQAPIQDPTPTKTDGFAEALRNARIEFYKFRPAPTQQATPASKNIFTSLRESAPQLFSKKSLSQSTSSEQPGLSSSTSTTLSQSSSRTANNLYIAFPDRALKFYEALKKYLPLSERNLKILKDVDTISENTKTYEVELLQNLHNLARGYRADLRSSNIKYNQVRPRYLLNLINNTPKGERADIITALEINLLPNEAKKTLLAEKWIGIKSKHRLHQPTTATQPSPTAATKPDFTDLLSLTPQSQEDPQALYQEFLNAPKKMLNNPDKLGQLQKYLIQDIQALTKERTKLEKLSKGIFSNHHMRFLRALDNNTLIPILQELAKDRKQHSNIAFFLRQMPANEHAKARELLDALDADNKILIEKKLNRHRRWKKEEKAFNEKKPKSFDSNPPSLAGSTERPNPNNEKELHYPAVKPQLKAQAEAEQNKDPKIQDILQSAFAIGKVLKKTSSTPDAKTPSLTHTVRKKPLSGKSRINLP